MLVRDIRNLIEMIAPKSEGGGSCVYFLDQQDKVAHDNEEDIENEENHENKKSEAIFDYEATNGKVIKKKRKWGKEYSPERNKPIDDANLRKGRASAHSPASDLKRKISMLVRSKKVKEDVNLDSDIINRSLSSYKLQLNEENPIVIWNIYSPNKNIIKISLNVDLKAVGEGTNYEELIDSILNESKIYPEFIQALSEFSPNNPEIKELDNLANFDFDNQGDVVTYSFTLRI